MTGTLDIKADVAYSIGTGKLFCDMNELHRTMEELLGRPVFTHEMASKELWEKVRRALEDYFTTYITT